MSESWGILDNSARSFSSGLHALSLPLAGSRLRGRSLRSRPTLQKARFLGYPKTPLNLPNNLPQARPATTRRARAPATGRPEAHFHPGRGGRQTSKGGGGGRAPGTPRPPRQRPRCSRRARGKAEIRPANAKAAVRALSFAEGLRKTAAGRPEEPSGKCTVTERWRKPGVRLQLPGRMLRRRAHPARKRTRETGAAREPGARGDAGQEGDPRGPGGRQMPAAGRTAAGSLPPARFCRREKRLLVTGRAAAAARARTASPPEHTPGPAAAAYLPTGRLPSSLSPATPAASGAHGLDEPLDPAWDPPAAPDPSSPSPNCCQPWPPLPPTPLQLLPRDLPAPAAPAPGSGPASPAPPRELPPPSLANQRARGLAPLRWHRARRCHSPRGQRAGGQLGGALDPADPSCGPAPFPAPSRGMPWATPPSALGFRPPAGQVALRLGLSQLPGVFETGGGGSGRDRGRVQTRSCVLIAVS